MNDGEIGLYKSDGTTQIQTTPISQLGRMYIPNNAATFGQDPTQPGTNLSAHSNERFGNTLLGIANASAIIVLMPQGTTNRLFGFGLIKSRHTERTDSQLNSITHLKGDYTAPSEGIGWNVILGWTTNVTTSGIIDLAKLVLKTDLEGSETDLFSSYTNGFIGSGYRSGSWVLSSDTSGVPTEANLVRQPDITTGSGTVAFGRFRTDADPNHLEWDAVLTADKFENGDILYASIDGDKTAHLQITLTSDLTLVGSGDAQYVYATASWIETGNIADVVDYGDYFRIGLEVPSKLQIELPYTDILGAPWLSLSGTELDDGTLSDEDEVVFSDGDKATIRHINEFHDENHVGTLTIGSLRYVTTSSPATGGDINFAVNSLNSAKGLVTYKYADADAKNKFKPKIVVGRRFRLQLTNSIYVSGNYRFDSGRLVRKIEFNLNHVTEVGTRTNNHAASIIVDANIPARGQH